MKKPFESFTQKLADPHYTKWKPTYLSKKLQSKAAKARLKGGSMGLITKEFCTGNEPNGPRQSHKAKAVLFSVRGPSGGISGDPSISGWGALVQRKLHTFTTPPAMVYDAEGKLIAKIVVDPVTGKRTREEINHGDGEVLRVREGDQGLSSCPKQ